MSGSFSLLSVPGVDENGVCPYPLFGHPSLCFQLQREYREESVDNCIFFCVDLHLPECKPTNKVLSFIFV